MGAGTGLSPELATNWGIGFDYTPTGNFLTGLNIQATYYVIKMTNVLQASATRARTRSTIRISGTSPSWSRPTLPTTRTFRATRAAPATCCRRPAHRSRPRSRVCWTTRAAAVDPQAKTLIYWINDGGTFNKGYDQDRRHRLQCQLRLGLGRYRCVQRRHHRHLLPAPLGKPARHRRLRTRTCSTPTCTRPGQRSARRGIAAALPLPRSRGLVERSVVAHRLHELPAHFFHTQNAPPNVNGNFCASNGGLDAVGNGGTFPAPSATTPTSFRPTTRSICRSATTRWTRRRTSICAISASSSWCRTSWIRVRLTATASRTGGGNPCTCDILNSLQGRTISLILTKEW